MVASKIYSKSEGQLEVFYPFTRRIQLRIALGDSAVALGLARSFSTTSGAFIKHPINTEEIADMTLPAEYVNLATSLKSYIEQYFENVLGVEEPSIADFEILLQQIETFPNNLFSFNGITGIEYNGKLQIGFEGGFRVALSITDANKEIIVHLDSGFVRILAGGIATVGMEYDLTTESFKPINERIQRDGSFMVRAVRSDLDYFAATRFLQSLFPTAVLTLTPLGIIGSNISTKSFSEYTSGIFWYELNEKMELVPKRRMVIPLVDEISRKVANVGANALNLIASRGAAQTGLTKVVEKAADAAKAVQDLNILSSEFGKSTQRAHVKVINVIEKSLKENGLFTEDDLNEALQYVSLASQAGKAFEVTRISKELKLLAAEAFSTFTQLQGRNHYYFIGDRLIGAQPSVFFRPIASVANLDAFEPIKLSDNVKLSEFSTRLLSSEEAKANAEFLEQMRASYRETARLKEENINHISSINLQNTNREYQKISERVELVLNEFSKVLAGQQQVTASAKAVLDEIAKIMCHPLGYGPYNIPLGIVGDYVELVWNGASSTATFDNDKMESFMKKTKRFSTTTRIKTSWDVHEFMKGDSTTVSSWSTREIQAFDQTWSKEALNHKSDTLRVSRVFSSYLKPYGAIEPTWISVEVCSLKTKKQGCSTVQITPQILYSFYAIDRVSGLTKLAAALQQLMRSDALAAVGAAGSLVNNMVANIAALQKERDVYGAEIATYTNAMRLDGEYAKQLNYLKPFMDFKGETTQNALVESEDVKIDTILEKDSELPKSNIISRQKQIHPMLNCILDNDEQAKKLFKNIQSFQTFLTSFNGGIATIEQLNEESGLKELPENIENTVKSKETELETLGNEIANIAKEIEELSKQPEQNSEAIKEKTAKKNQLETQKDSLNGELEILKNTLKTARTSADSLKQKVKKEVETMISDNVWKDASSLHSVDKQVWESFLQALETHFKSVGTVYKAVSKLVADSREKINVMKQAYNKLVINYKSAMNGRNMTITGLIRVDRAKKQVVVLNNELTEKMTSKAGFTLKTDSSWKFAASEIAGLECLFVVKYEEKDSTPQEVDSESLSSSDSDVNQGVIKGDCVKVSLLRVQPVELKRGVEIFIPQLGYVLTLQGFIASLFTFNASRFPPIYFSKILATVVGANSLDEILSFLDYSNLTEMEKMVLEGLVKQPTGEQGDANNEMQEQMLEQLNSTVLSALGMYLLDLSGVGELRLNELQLEKNKLNSLTNNVIADMAVINML